MQRISVGLEKLTRQAMAIDTSFGDGDRTTPLTEPMPMQTTQQTMGMAVPPFLIGYYTRLTGQHTSSQMRMAYEWATLGGVIRY